MNTPVLRVLPIFHQKENDPGGSFSFGATNGNRTRNTGTTNQCDNRFTIVAMVHPAGLEPATSRLEPSCSNPAELRMHFDTGFNSSLCGALYYIFDNKSSLSERSMSEW